MTTAFARPPIPVIVQQHAEESAMLRHIRSVLVRAPHVRLRHLRRLDDRIAAHLDGLAVAGAYGTALCTAALERPGAGEVFALAVRSIDERDERALDRLVALSAVLPDAKRGLLSAFGWVSAAQLRGIVAALLASPDARRRELAISACRLHGVDPGAPLTAASRGAGDADAGLRAAALRAAAALGRVDTLADARAAIDDADGGLAFQAAASACLLGDRGVALAALETIAHTDGSDHQDAALGLLLLACDFHHGREIVRGLAQRAPRGAAAKRRVIRACGLLGDARSVGWLIELMADDTTARIAGESFSLISGADLAALDLERKPPPGARMGPTEDPDDDDVALDEDESLPWPDAERVQRWWHAHAAGMPADARCLMGGPATAAQCQAVLRDGTQRQRIVAAQQACLQAAGTPLFQVCAPAWRQQRRFAAH